VKPRDLHWNLGCALSLRNVVWSYGFDVKPRGLDKNQGYAL